MSNDDNIYRRSSSNGGGTSARGSHQSALESEGSRSNAVRSSSGNGNGGSQVRSSGSGNRSTSGQSGTEKKYIIRRIVFGLIVLALLILIIVGIVNLIKGIVKPKTDNGNSPVMSEVRFEAGDIGPAAEQLLTTYGKAALEKGAFVRYETDISQLNFHKLENYKIKLIYTDENGTESSYTVTVKVVDTVPPQGVARDRMTVKGVPLEVGDFIESVSDQTDVAVSLVKEPDYNKVGVQTVDILLEDRGGNKTRITASLTVTED